MTAANPLTPEHVSEVAEEIALTLPPDSVGSAVFDPDQISRVLSGARAPSQIVEVRLMDQYGNVVATAPINCPIVANGGDITIQVPPIVLIAS